ncbi:hypothetical protein FN846DRAFT_775551 [Sphaerosporella brunnea]|uniref:Uncharacterized protein n=1 Tax=Sphaerosporella brunnea TaxID=1250544 RepID=A0A5J5F1Y9_9PEZI|nr:hypothetical protein FN846DRAFT_775551 [Sphaerosporella brunnea]
MASLRRALVLFAARKPAVTSTVLHHPASPGNNSTSAEQFSLRTAFGVQITINEGAVENELTVDRTLGQNGVAATGQEAAVSEGENISATETNGSAAEFESYQILSDYQTSFLWEKENDSVDCAKMHVDDPKDLFPHTAPFLEAWVEEYERLFEANEVHLGSGKDVFSTVEEHVSWEVEGALLALSLLIERSSVASVEFVSSAMDMKLYKFARHSPQEILHTFLLDMASLLPRFALHAQFGELELMKIARRIDSQTAVGNGVGLGWVGLRNGVCT